MIIKKSVIIGNVVRARKVSGSRWMVYKLKEADRPDFCGNRVPLQWMYGKKQTIKYVDEMDPEGDDEDEAESE